MERIGIIRLQSKVKLVCSAIFLVFVTALAVRGQVYVSPNANVYFGSNSTVQINTNLTISSGATLTQNGTGTIYIAGDWTNNGGTFNPGTGIVIFIGNSNSTIGGTGSTNFYNLKINKTTNGSDVVLVGNNLLISNQLQIDDGVFRLGNSNYVKVIIYGDVSIASVGLFDVINSLPNAFDTVKFGGNLFVDGTLDFNMSNGKVWAFFINSGNSELSGTGTVDLYEVIMRKASSSDMVTFKRSFSAPDGFLTLDTGIFKIEGSYSFSNTFFKPQTGSGNCYIGSESEFWLDNPNVTVNGQPLAGNLYLRGSLKIAQGTVNVGTTGESSIIYDNSPPKKSKLTISSGTLNVWTRISPQTYGTNLIDFDFSGGSVKVGVGSSSSETGVGLFDISASGSSFNWSGGTLELNRTANNSVADYVVLASTGTVGGGLLKIDAQTTNQTFDINTTKPVYEVVMTGTNNPVVRLVSNNLTILTNLTLAGSGTGRFDANNLNITIGGDWFNNFVSADGFTAGTGTVTFNGSATQNIGGSQSTKFYNLTVNKSGGDLEVNQPTTVENDLRLLSNTIVDLNSNDLTIGANGHIYSDNGTQEDLSTFNSSKFIVNSGSGSNPLAGAKLIRRVATGVTLPLNLRFPIGTPGRYSPAMITFNFGGATFGANAFVSVKPVPLEHPGVELSNKSLTKYWVVDDNDITYNSQGATVRFFYNLSEVQGNESNYVVLYYSPSYNDPNGYWRVNPGVNNSVDVINRLFYAQQIDSIAGDWTAGETDAAYATFFARADGDFNNANTWSNVGFNGPASSKYPSKPNHRARIQDHEISVNANIPPLNLLSVEDGTEGRQPGKLTFTNDYYVQGDTFRIEQNTKLKVSHSNGIAAVPTNAGCVRTTVRNLSSAVVYEFTGTGSQSTGDGIPNIVRGFVVSKPANQVLTLGKSVQISDSLVINDGVLDLASYNLNGQSGGQTLTMRGGEMIIRQSFPTNYTAPSFTVGRITFDGTGNVTIPSSGSSPAVLQYYDLKIAGNTRSGNVTFASSGEIRVKNQLDISSLSFSNNTYRFFTNGSTVRFNKSGGVQNIPLQPSSPSDSSVFLEYYNLIIDSSGTKQLTASGTPTFKVLNNLKIDNGATFSTNNFSLEVQGNWENSNGSVFVPGTASVIFRNPNPLTTTTITSRDTTDNPFNNVVIAGSGIVKPLDDIKIQGNLLISSGSTLEMTSNLMSLYGNWTDQGGTFTYGTSTVMFTGTSTQYITRTSGNSNFYNIIVRNTANVDGSGVGSTTDGIVVNNNLVLDAGNLRTHIGTNFRFVTVLGSLNRPGGGYVDGELRKTVGTGTTSVTFEVGYGSRYTPVQIDFYGSGGASGLLGVLSDTIHTTTSPISWQGDPPTDLLPSGSEMSPNKHVARQYSITIPSGSSFALGGSRKYNATFTFVGTAAPNGDLRNGANTSLFEARLRAGSNWIGPFYYGTYPLMGVRNANTAEFDSLVDFGTFVVGEPAVLTFYTRANGNWTTISNWSTQGYGGSPAPEYPGQSSNNFRAYIGNGNTITFNQNVIVNTSSPYSGWVQVDSSGLLDFDTYVLSGTGEFRLAKNGAVRTANVNGFRAVGALGSVQTTTRNYDYGSHGRAHFIYSGNQNQTQANEAIPTSVGSLTVDKTANTLTFNRSTTILDSIFIKQGSMTLGANITVNGNFRRNSGTTFNPGTTTITFSGLNGDTISNLDSNPLNFYNLTLAKASGSGDVVLSQNSAIQISNNLTFSTAGSNKSLINARSYSGTYVIMGQTATVSNASNARGWVNGELRKYIQSGDAPAVTFEVGDSLRYSPFLIDFRSGSNSGSAGYLAVKVFPGRHPYMDLAYNPPIAPSRLIGPKWWRLTKPNGSTFQRGNRNFDPRVYFVVPGDDANVDYWGCADLTYLREWTADVDWQPLYPNSTLSNDGAFGCGDTRNAALTPNFTYSGALSGGLAYVNVANVNTSFGSTEFIGSDTLLGDFVAGNQNSIARFYEFYSIRDGDWTDPATWSTVSLADTVNPTNLAASDTTGGRNRIIYGFPRRQYDNVIIGNRKRVRLDANIGTNTLTTLSTYELNALAGPSVVVLDSGILDLNYHVLRGNAFAVRNGGKLISGSTSGITTGNSGNINLYPGVSPSYSDSISIVYSAEGYTSDVARYFTTWPARDGTTYYLERVAVRNASDNSLIMDNITLDTLTRSIRCINIYIHKKAVLTAGSSYYLQIDPSNTGGQRRYKIWIDYNRDGDYLDAGEQVINQTSNSNTLFNTSSFTVPTGTTPGSTQMRVGMQNGTGDYGPTASGTGEFEEYTVDIINTNPTITQSTGNGLPNILRSIEVHSPRNGSIVQLGKSITVLDSVRIRSGQLQAQANNITLYGDFVSDTANGFSPGTGSVYFRNHTTSNIRGTATNIAFNNIYLQKSAIDTLNVRMNIIVAGTLRMDSLNIINLSDNTNISFSAPATLTYTGSAFSNRKMIKVSGGANTGTVTKNFQTGSGVTRTFAFPLGIDTVFNMANISITGNFTGTPSLEMILRGAQHPNRQNDYILKKYWTVNPTGISNITASTYEFDFFGVDTSGDVSRYIPARYKSGSGWEINLGPSPNISNISYGYRIQIVNDTSYNGSKLAGDWTAGDPTAFFNGLVFYSRASGGWGTPSNWSIDAVAKHNGPPASYYPGQLYIQDTVNIDGHTIYYNVQNVEIDSLRLGGTNASPNPGQLLFDSTANNKVLKTRQLFIDNENVTIQTSGWAALLPRKKVDTLIITQNLIHNGSGSTGFNLFPQFSANDSDYVVLKFAGSGNSRISGPGPWSSMRSLVIAKNGGLSDSVFVETSALCNFSSNSTKHFFKFDGGVLVQNTTSSPNNLYISGFDLLPVSMSSNSGLSIFDGSVRSRATITTSANTIIHLRKGDLYVGEAHPLSTIYGSFLYNTGTTVRIDTGTFNVARAFARVETNSTVDFTLQPAGIVKVNTVGLGSYDPTKIGFDISNSGSSFTMTGGRIIVTNALGTSPSSFDFRVNAQNGSGMTGGTIQSGDTLLTPNNTIIKLGGTFTIKDLHFANSLSNAVTTQVAEQTLTIAGNWTIDANHTFNLNGNTVIFGGNLTNYGTFVGSPTGPTSDSWLFELNGNNDQTFFSNSSAFDIYNLKINKSSGNVLLSASGNSDFKVHNTLEFANSNNAFISAPIQSGRFVELSPISGSTPTILRNGKGHVVGRLYRYVGDGNQNVFFPVGADSIGSYRPVWFESSGTGNTAGLVGVVSFNLQHPRISEVNVDTSKILIRYWKVTPPANGGYALGSGNTFNLKVQFLNPSDFKPGSDLTTFKMLNFNPACPDPPASCSNSGIWTLLTTPDKTDTTLRSTGNTLFGDFTAGTFLGVVFWSRNNGFWNNPATWSLKSYYEDSLPPRIPNQTYDIVRIGNGKTVSIPDGFSPNVKSVFVEKDSVNYSPGTLMIYGTLGYLAGQNFALEDSCTIGVQNQNGIARVVDGNIGAVQTSSRNYGVGRFIFFNSSSSMSTGLGLPDSIKTMIIDNTYSVNNSVYLSNYGGAPAIKIADTLLVKQGTFNVGNRNMTLYGVMILDSNSIEGKFEPTNAEVSFDGSNEKYLMLKNRSGARFYNLTINNGNLNITRPIINDANRQHTFIDNNLNFSNPNTYITLFDSVNLKVTNSSATAIQNADANRFVKTSLASGMLIRAIATGQTYTFPIGSGNIYAPAIFEASASGSNGTIGVRTSPGQSTYQLDGHRGLSPSTAAIYIKRYWTIDSVTAQINGKWTFYYDDNDVVGDETQITKIGRWRPAWETTGGSWAFPFNPSSINTTNNTFETSTNFAYSGFYGDWTIGNENAFRRILYSRQSGPWSSDQSWTYSPSHSGPIAGVGVYPNAPDDSCVVGGGNNGVGNHEITLDLSNPFNGGANTGVAVGTGTSNTGTLNLGTNILDGDYFTLGDYSSLKIGSPDGIFNIGQNLGNIRTTQSRNYNTNGIYIYNASGNQTLGDGLPSTVYSFVVDNSGAYPNNVLTVDRNITVQKDLSVLNGTLDLQTYSMNSVPSGTGTVTLGANIMLRVGGTNNLSNTINNYSNYNINTTSIVHFNGTNQTISSLPTNLTQDFVNNIGGLGTVWLSNSGTKLVTQPLLIRGNLVTFVGITLQNNAGVDALSVRGSIINNASIFNEGVIEIGN